MKIIDIRRARMSFLEKTGKEPTRINLSIADAQGLLKDAIATGVFSKEAQAQAVDVLESKNVGQLIKFFKEVKLFNMSIALIPVVQ